MPPCITGIYLASARSGSKAQDTHTATPIL